MSDSGLDDDHGLDDAYGVETPDDNRRLYRSWAATYETGFILDHGYVYPARLASVFAAHAGAGDSSHGTIGPILDVGCGTGVGAVELARALGHRPVIDGLDISPEMLGQARLKRAGDQPLYRRLIEADLTGRLDIDDDEYGSLVSAGTFTHGHVGPEAVAELIRITRSGGLLCLGVNEEHFEARGFDEMFRTHAAAGRIEAPSFERISMYDAAVADHEHVTETALVALARVG